MTLQPPGSPQYKACHVYDEHGALNVSTEVRFAIGLLHKQILQQY